MRRLLSILFILCLLVPRLAEAKSLALIIGNQSYAQIAPLQKAKADAEGYAALFGAQAFTVTLAIDLDRGAMLETLANFYDQIAPGDTVLFAYSGHGWSDGQQNYLLPVDIRSIGSQTLLAGESFVLRNGVNGILDEIAARKPQLTVAIVDACRDNPFLADPLTRSAGLSRGLVRLQPPSGTFIAFSAGEGQTALDRLSDDDPSPYSVFTRVFLGELALPQDLQAAFKTTQMRVNAIALTIGHPQRPAYYDEVVGAACIDARCRVEADADDLAAGAEPPIVSGTGRDSAADPSAIAAREWQDFRGTTSVEALEAYARRHEGTVYAILARARITELTEAAATSKAVPDEAAKAQPDADTAALPEIEADLDAEPISPEANIEPSPPKGPASGPAGGPLTELADKPGSGRAAPADDTVSDKPKMGRPSNAAGGRRPGRPAPGAEGARQSPPALPEPWCTASPSKTEAVICSNPRLAALHLRVDALMLARHGALDPDGRLALLQSHRVWRQSRDSCGANPACIEDFLHARIEALGRSVWRASNTPPARL